MRKLFYFSYKLLLDRMFQYSYDKEHTKFVHYLPQNVSQDKEQKALCGQRAKISFFLFHCSYNHHILYRYSCLFQKQVFSKLCI